MDEEPNDHEPSIPPKKRSAKTVATGVAPSAEEMIAARKDIRLLFKIAILTMLLLTVASVLTALGLTVHAQLGNGVQVKWIPVLVPTGTSGLFSAGTLKLLSDLYRKFF